MFSQLSCPGQTRTRVVWELMRVDKQEFGSEESCLNLCPGQTRHTMVRLSRFQIQFQSSLLDGRSVDSQGSKHRLKLLVLNPCFGLIRCTLEPFSTTLNLQFISEFRITLFIRERQRGVYATINFFSQPFRFTIECFGKRFVINMQLR